jgi:hypothetical protein
MKWLAVLLLLLAATATQAGAPSNGSATGSGGSNVPAGPPEDRKPYPDAYGFGAKAQVGLTAGAYTVYSVTNANDSGAGSARACLEATGNRICVLKTGGTVQLASAIKVVSGNVYFAGQRAPAGFQFVKGAGYAYTDIGLGGTYQYVLHLAIGAPDVVIRNVRFRHGDQTCDVGPCHWHFSIMALNNADRVLLDQLSSSWSTEDAIDIGYLTSVDGPNDTTIQRTLIGQPMYVETLGTIDSEPGHTIHTLGDRVSLIGNYFVSAHRWPNFSGGGQQEAINNVVKQSDYIDAYSIPVSDCGGATAEPTQVEFIGNQWYKASGVAGTIEPVLMVPQRNCTGDTTYGCDGLMVHLQGNRSHKNTDPDATQADHVKCNWQGFDGEDPGEDMGCSGDTQYTLYEECESTNVSATRLFTGYAPPSILPISDGTAATIVAGAGAMPRDAVDNCLVALVNGAQIETVAAGCNGGPDTFAAGTWCGTLGGDADADSMCDAWENTYFGGLSAVGVSDPDLDGYSNLEEFLNNTSPVVRD